MHRSAECFSGAAGVVSTALMLSAKEKLFFRGLKPQKKMELLI